MSRKSFPAAAVFAAALAAPCANAVSLNPRGLGEVLVYPYYTVNKNQDTVVTIGNASDSGKMVAVRIATAARSDVAVHPRIYDQEEAFAPCPDCGDGTDGTPMMLPRQVNVLTFRALGSADAPSEVLGSRLALSVEPWGNAGWMELDLANGDGGPALVADVGGVLHGLPATGFMVYNIINANAAPGRLANYGGAFAHRASVGYSQQSQTDD